MRLRPPPPPTQRQPPRPPSPSCPTAPVRRFRSGAKGMVQMQIVDEQIVETASAAPSDSDEAAFDSAQAAIKEDSNAGGGVVGGDACYLALQLPSLSAPTSWVLMLYIPAGSAVRDRMLYASTKDTVKKELGASNFASDLYGNSKEELTLAAYRYKADGEAAGPTTAVEAELDELALEESRAASGGAQSGVAVAFALQAAGSEALAALAKGSKQWVSLQVNTKDETIELVEAFDSLAADEWPSKLPEDRPRYIFVASGEGAVSMVYYCPDAAPIKEKMLGSTVKASAQAQASHRKPPPRSPRSHLLWTL